MKWKIVPERSGRVIKLRYWQQKDHRRDTMLEFNACAFGEIDQAAIGENGQTTNYEKSTRYRIIGDNYGAILFSNK